MRTIDIDVENLNVRSVWFNTEKVYFDFQDGRTAGLVSPPAPRHRGPAPKLAADWARLRGALGRPGRRPLGGRDVFVYQGASLRWSIFTAKAHPGYQGGLLPFYLNERGQ